MPILLLRKMSPPPISAVHLSAYPSRFLIFAAHEKLIALVRSANLRHSERNFRDSSRAIDQAESSPRDLCLKKSGLRLLLPAAVSPVLSRSLWLNGRQINFARKSGLILRNRVHAAVRFSPHLGRNRISPYPPTDRQSIKADGRIDGKVNILSGMNASSVFSACMTLYYGLSAQLSVGTTTIPSNLI